MTRLSSVRCNGPMIGADRGDLWRWEGFDPARLDHLMRGFGGPWWVAGGRALDLWLGRETRPHRDVDVAVLRGDQRRLRDALRRWDLFYASPDHCLLPLDIDQWLDPPIHGIWARQSSDAPWTCEFLLNEHDDLDWVYRRDPRVRKPLVEVGTTVSNGGRRLPVLSPEVVLLYKAHDLAAGKGTAKAEADFGTALPHLGHRAEVWLREALVKSVPGHPWLGRLAR